jgi:hypothetical protein
MLTFYTKSKKSQVEIVTSLPIEREYKHFVYLAGAKCFQREVAEWVQPSAAQYEATDILFDSDSASLT